MNFNILRRRSLMVPVILGATASIAITFQNCSNPGFQYNDGTGGSTSLGSSSSTGASSSSTSSSSSAPAPTNPSTTPVAPTAPVSPTMPVSPTSPVQPTSPAPTAPPSVRSQVFAKTLSAALAGNSESSFRLSDTVYAVARGFGGGNTWGCFAPLSSSDCSDKTKWTKLPNGAWTFNAADQTWRMQQNFLWLAPSAVGNHVAHIEDRSVPGSAVATVIQLTCTYQWVGFVAGPVAGPSQTCSQSNLNSTIVQSGTTYTCECR